MQVLQSYLLAHLDLQTMYNVIYLDRIMFKNINTDTILDSKLSCREYNFVLELTFES